MSSENSEFFGVLPSPKGTRKHLSEGNFRISIAVFEGFFSVSILRPLKIVNEIY